MPGDFQHVTQVPKTRAPHQCQWCGTLIALGTEATKVSGHGEGDFYRFYIHPDCATAWERDPCTLEDEEGCPYRHRRGMTCFETTDAEEAADA